MTAVQADGERNPVTTQQEIADLRVILEAARRLHQSREPQVRGGMTRIVVIATNILRNLDLDFFEKALEWEGPPRG
jgi:hypothetical protein